MGKQKLFRVQAMNESGMLMQVEVLGRKAQSLALRDALDTCSAQGSGVIRAQTDGARGWAVYVYDARHNEAQQVYKDEAAQICARFEEWIATGGKES